MDQTRFFLLALLSILPNDVYFYIWHLIDKNQNNCQYFLGPQGIQAAYNFLANNQSIGNLYLGVTGCRQDLGNRNRPKKDNDDCAGIFAFWVDVDVEHQCHKRGNLPTDLKQAVELSCSIGIQPSFLVNSGHGIHAWYLLDRFFHRTTETASFINSLLLAIKEKFQSNKWGYAVDNTFETSRLLRIPGTANWKMGYDPVPVSLISPVPFSAGELVQLKRHSIEEWANCLGVNLSGNIQVVTSTMPRMIVPAGIPMQASVISTPSVIPVTQPIVSTTPISSTGTTRIPAGIPDQAPSISTPATVIPTVSPTPYPGLNILPPAIPTHAPVIPTVAPVIQTAANVPTQSPVSVPPASMPVIPSTLPVPVGQVTTQQPPVPSSPPVPPFVLNQNVTLNQAAFDRLYREKEQFRLSWERQRTDLRDNSSSGYDQSVANYGVYAGWLVTITRIYMQTLENLLGFMDNILN